MHLLGIDVGSSSVKCALLRGGRVAGPVVHAKFSTRTLGVRVEVQPAEILRAVQAAVADVGSAARRAQAIALSVFSPGWVAIDARGKALTPIVTHQDRRSVAAALELERRVGESRYLQLAGTRPFPGGISSTTWAWYLKHEPGRLRNADLVGHLNTFLHRALTGARVVDPANASFMGVYSTFDQSDWNDELCQAVGAKRSQLPEVREANVIGGRLTRQAAGQLGLPEGMPMMVGVVDGSAAMLAAGATPGQLLNVCGSTDVLALCTDRYQPNPRLLTRSLGIDDATLETSNAAHTSVEHSSRSTGRRLSKTQSPRKLWLSVSTLAAAGAALAWAREQLFADYDWPGFEKLVIRTSRDSERQPRNSRERGSAPAPIAHVQFEPYLAGDRMSIEQQQAAFTGLTLATTREQMLWAMVEALSRASAARLELLQKNAVRIHKEVVITGGAGKLATIFRRDWPGRWSFRRQKEATLGGLARLQPRDE